MAFTTLNRRVSAVGSTTNATTWSPTYTYALNNAIPAGQETLWINTVSSDGSPTLSETGGNGWTQLTNDLQGTQPTEAIFVKITNTAFAASAQPAFVLGSTASEQYTLAQRAYTAAVGKSIAYILSPTAATGSSTNTDPPSVTNTSGASQDCTAVVTRTGDSTNTVSVVPAGYSGGVSGVAAGTGGATTNTAEKQVTLAASASEDPGTFTNTIIDWVSRTMLVYEFTPTIPASLPLLTQCAITPLLMR